MSILLINTLLKHAMKARECVFKRRIGEKVKIGDLQFGFISGKGTLYQSLRSGRCRTNMTYILCSHTLFIPFGIQLPNLA